jgi:hypothetical protein
MSSKIKEKVRLTLTRTGAQPRWRPRKYNQFNFKKII